MPVTMEKKWGDGGSDIRVFCFLFLEPCGPWENTVSCSVEDFLAFLRVDGCRNSLRLHLSVV